MAAGIKIERRTVGQLKKLRDSYARRAKQFKQLDVPNKRVAVFLDRWVQDNFRTEGGKVGGWKPLKLGGRVMYRQTAGGGKVRSGFDSTAKILRDTATLQHSFIPFSNKRTAGIGSDLDYSKSHDEGIGVPKRRILPLHREVDKNIKLLYTQWGRGILNDRRK